MCKPCHLTRSREWDAANPTRAIYRSKKGHAKTSKVEFDLPYDSIVWPEHCPVLGIPLDYTTRTKGAVKSNSPSFDRIDPNKGYVIGNVIIVSNKANVIKSNATVDELERVASFYRQLNPTSEKE